MADERTWVTPEAHRRLVEEFEGLSALGEEAEAPARARLVELRSILDSVEVGTRPDDGLVEAGMNVTVRSAEDSTETAFVLGDRALLGDDLGADVTVLSPKSPLGKAVNGRNVGDEVTFTAPRGERTVVIVDASPVG